MQYITFFAPAQKSAPGQMPDPKHMEEMGKLMTEWMAKGVLVATGGIGRAAEGFRITSKDGDFIVRDGADQTLAASVEGFAILQGSSKEDILDATKAFLKVAGSGVVDLFPLIGPPPQK
jgi:hypothetical protein